MDSDPGRYLSYLLRVWTVDQDGNLVWRASLESPQTGERLGFGDLEALFEFLRQQTTAPARTRDVIGQG